MEKNSKSRQVLFSSDARKALFRGLDVAAKAVGATLGPRGRCVIIQSEDDAPPIVTKDGVTVCKSIKLKDPLARMGAQMVMEAASQTNDVAGDGTTTATVLTHAMVRAGIKLLEAGYSSRDLCAGVESATSAVSELVRSMAHPVETREEMVHVATVSANGDRQMGEMIAEAMTRVGKDGVVTVEDAKGTTTSLEVVEGTRFDRGYLSPYFVTDPARMVAQHEAPRVMLVDGKLSALKDLVPTLEGILRSNSALLIVADEVEGDALQGLVVNRVNANLRVVAVRTPGYGRAKDDALKDLSVLTGATVFGTASGVAVSACNVAQHLGRLKRVLVDAKSTTMVGDGSTADAVKTHVDNLRNMTTDPTTDIEEAAHLRVRAARLASGVAVVKVGGATELEMVERRHRVEDALNATRAAAEEGIVPGGGLALAHAARGLMSDERFSKDAGAKAVLDACFEPIRRIVDNAGESPPIVLEELTRSRMIDGKHHLPGEFGYDAATGRYVDPIAAGIVDPVKVTRTALRNAASVAITFLSLDAAVAEET